MSQPIDAARQILNAQMAAYAGLFHTLKDAGLITADAVTATLTGYAERVQTTQPLAAAVLRAYVVAVSGDQAAAEEAADKLH